VSVRLHQDAADGRRVVECLLRYLDENRLWARAGAADAHLAVLRQACAEEHQRYLLFSALLRHVAADGLSPAERQASRSLRSGAGFLP
jgi:hypothetical protein